MALAAVGAVMLLGVSPSGDGSLYLMVVASLVMSLALSPVITLATELIVGSAPPEQAGAATGMSETSGELGGALGIAILGSVAVAVYRSEVAATLPAGIGAEVAEAARDTLGGAIAVAQTLPAEVAAAVVAAAQVAFVDSIHVVAVVSGIGAVATAIGAAIALRGVPARTEAAEREAAVPEVVGATD
jgi:DHA2 family multidrug resistance protein-like MFS transporter